MPSSIWAARRLGASLLSIDARGHVPCLRHIAEFRVLGLGFSTFRACKGSVRGALQGAPSFRVGQHHLFSF